MILSENTKRTNKNKQNGQEEPTQDSQGEGEEWQGRAMWGLVDINCFIWNGWAMRFYCTAQGNMCVWVTLLYNGT